MKSFFKKGIESLRNVADKATDEIAAKVALFQEKVDGLPVFVSSEKSDKFEAKEYDEKHYFVIPFELSEYKFALHTMRCLPNGVPEINNLPKRRVFHFPHEHAEDMLKSYMRQTALNKITKAILVASNRWPTKSIHLIKNSPMACYWLAAWRLSLTLC